MKITVERFASDSDATLSLISIDGRFECFGLEDEYRAEKVASETRIPAGTYRVGLRDAGGMTKRYAEKFPDLHRGMLHVLDVPGFEWIYFHIGNTDQHTAGCIIVGTGATAQPAEKRLLSSTDAYRRLYSKVVEAADKGRLSVEVIDRDRAAV